MHPGCVKFRATTVLPQGYRPFVRSPLATAHPEGRAILGEQEGMTESVENCSRRRAARTTFDVLADQLWIGDQAQLNQAFCVCRHCCRATVFQS